MEPMLLDVAKLLGQGGSLVFALLVFILLRDERRERAEERAADREDRARLADTLSRIDERTATLLGEVTPVERPPLRRNTPPAGVPSPTEYTYTGRRRGG